MPSSSPEVPLGERTTTATLCLRAIWLALGDGRLASRRFEPDSASVEVKGVWRRRASALAAVCWPATALGPKHGSVRIVRFSSKPAVAPAASNDEIAGHGTWTIPTRDPPRQRPRGQDGRAREGNFSLSDALVLCALLARTDPTRYERAALRWLQRFIDGRLPPSPRSSLRLPPCLSFATAAEMSELRR